MLSVLVIGFLAGGLGANGVPHFVKGVSGENHATPFGKSSSAAENVVWGWLNLAVAAIIWHFAPMRIHPRAAFIGVALGVLVIGVTRADSWGKRSARKT